MSFQKTQKKKKKMNLKKIFTISWITLCLLRLYETFKRTEILNLYTVIKEGII